MVRRQYIPTVIKFTGELAKTITNLKTASAALSVQKELLTTVSTLLDSASNKVADLEDILKKAQAVHEARKRAETYRDKVVPAMKDLRQDIDTLEGIVPTTLWPVPSYVEMLFKL